MVYLLKDPDIEKLCHHPDNLKLLWSVARIPDYAAQSHAHHFRLTKRIFWQLYKEGELSHLWVLRELEKLRISLGISDALQHGSYTNLFLAQRPDWLPNNEYWQPHLKELENKFLRRCMSA